MNNINAGSWQSEANCRGKMTVTNKMNMSQKGKPTDKEQSARNESQQGSSSKARNYNYNYFNIHIHTI